VAWEKLCGVGENQVGNPQGDEQGENSDDNSHGNSPAAFFDIDVHVVDGDSVKQSFRTA
jgi:hypothetical protein